MNFLPILALTTFIAVNGNVVEVPTDSPAAIAYEENSITDIGSEEYFESLSSNQPEATDTVSGSDFPPEAPSDNAEIVSLLEDSVALLAENSSSVTGAINNTILDLMDRMIDDYPSYYRYAGFRTSEDDTYQSTLYIAKKATVNGNTITFSEDCISITFDRYYYTDRSSYIYYTVKDAPNASVSLENRSIVYTNVLDGYPSLGDKSRINEEYLWIGLFALIIIIIFTRRNRSD